MSFLVLDIETTGLPDRLGYDKYYPPNDTSHYDNARIVSIAFLNQYFESYSLIKSDSEIPSESVSIHGITKTMTENSGVSLTDFFNKNLYEKILCSEYLVGHNILFDVSILASELFRNCLESLANIILNKPRICTMELGRKWMGQTTETNPKYIKNPKLKELYKFLFEKDFDAHNALEDAKACMKCYMEISNIL